MFEAFRLVTVVALPIMLPEVVRGPTVDTRAVARALLQQMIFLIPTAADVPGEERTTTSEDRRS